MPSDGSELEVDWDSQTNDNKIKIENESNVHRSNLLTND